MGGLQRIFSLLRSIFLLRCIIVLPSIAVHLGESSFTVLSVVCWCSGDIDAMVGTVVDVGVSISGPGHTTLVVEITADGFFYILYSMAEDGTLQTDELLSEIRMMTEAHEILED